MGETCEANAEELYSKPSRSDRTRERYLRTVRLRIQARRCLEAKVLSMLARHLRSLEGIQLASAEQIAAIAGIGPTIAAAVRAWFDTPRNAELAAALVDLGVRTTTDLAEPAAVESLALAGHTFVVTGTLGGSLRQSATKASGRGAVLVVERLLSGARQRGVCKE